MTRIPTILSAVALAALSGLAAEARPAKPQPNPALKARASAMNDFQARMSRLDALMGVQPAARVRSRSAEAGR
jgi:phage terminase small subunit